VLVTIVPIASGLRRIGPVPAEIRCGRDGRVSRCAEHGAERDTTDHRSMVRPLVPLPIGPDDDDLLVVPMLVVPVLVLVLSATTIMPSVSLAVLVLLVSPPLQYRLMSASPVRRSLRRGRSPRRRPRHLSHQDFSRFADTTLIPHGFSPNWVLIAHSTRPATVTLDACASFDKSLRSAAELQLCG
jgi:hypothetical protein